jgi:hypothetical protein
VEVILCWGERKADLRSCCDDIDEEGLRFAWKVTRFRLDTIRARVHKGVWC